MSYNYYNPYQENYQWWPFSSSCNKEVNAEKTKCTSDRNELARLQRITCPPQRVCPPPVTCDSERKSLSDLQSSYNELNQKYTRDQVELSRLRGKTCPTVTCPPQRVCPPQVTCPPQETCDSYIKILNDVQSSYESKFQGLQSNYQGLQSTYDSKYKDLQTSCDSQYTNYQTELANLRKMTSTCEQDRNSLSSLQSSYQNLEKNYQDLQSSYESQVAQNLIFLKCVKNVKYKVTKTNRGWDLYEPYRPNDEELKGIVNDLFKDPEKTTTKINELENSLGGRGTIPDDKKGDTQENREYIFEKLKEKYEYADVYKTISPFYNKIGSLGINDIKLLTKNGRFQKVELNHDYSISNCGNGSAKITNIDYATNTIDYECLDNPSVIGTLLYGPYKLNPAYTQIFNQVKADVIRKQEQQVSDMEKLQQDKTVSQDEINRLNDIEFRGRTSNGCSNINTDDPSGMTDCQRQDRIKNLEKNIKEANEKINNIQALLYSPLFKKYSRDNIIIDIINDSKGNLDQINSIINPDDRFRSNSYNYGNKQQFDSSNTKYISILGRQFQFYEFPDQYEGKTLQELQIGDSFTIIDK